MGEKSPSWKKWSGKKISLAFREYKLNVCSPDQTNFEGTADYPKREIWVSSEAESFSHAREILFHEIVHCLLREMEELKLARNEKFVSQLSAHLETFLSKNLPFLEKVLKKG